MNHQSNLAYSRPVVLLDLLRNLTSVAVASTMLAISTNEKHPLLSVRLWVIGYAMQCVVYMVFVCFEYRRRRIAATMAVQDGGSLQNLERGWSSATTLRLRYGGMSDHEDGERVSKQLDHAIHMFALIWWIIGLYWVTFGISEAHDSPKLYWLSIAFLAFDLLFVAFCAIVAIICGLILYCFLPCFIEIIYVVPKKRDGATKEEICQLLQYKFQSIGNSERPDGEISLSTGIMIQCGSDAPLELKLVAEDTKCCICLCNYKDEEELRQLPCNHHFHCTCVDKWLYINATCPLCKYNIIEVNNGESEEVSQV